MQGFYSVRVSPPYLVCPPDHQVRKEGNPADRTKKRDRKKFSWSLKQKEGGTVKTSLKGDMPYS